jgi:putative FmdB family regulatory protein
MPTYEYECGACGHRFEEWQTITSEPLKKCPSCKKRKLERLLGTGGAIIFKGSGFYITDYRSEGYKEAAKSDSAKSESKGDAPSNESKGSESTSSAKESSSGGASAKTEPKKSDKGASKPDKKSDKK